jgi:hypothetical protein
MSDNSKINRILVAARIRPFVSREREDNDENVTNVSPDSKHLTLSSAVSTSTASKSFTFDRVFTPQTSQVDVFDTCVVPLLVSACKGYNTSIFTYGQTGTGKTHTMLGLDLWSLAKQSTTSSSSSNGKKMMSNYIATDDVHIGIIPRTARWLFEQAHNNNTINCMKMKVSYCELYNEKLLDLLTAPTTVTNTQQQQADTSLVRPSLDIRENNKGHIFVPGLTTIEVSSLDQVLDVLWIGAQTRSVAATDMNEYSSRSHTIFQLHLEIERVLTANTPITIPNRRPDVEIVRSKICLVDLAGSEKWKSHQLSTFSHERIVELTSINKSLSALGNVINALMLRSNPPSQQAGYPQSNANAAHIPYRDSKLTRLLQDSLGGNTRTAFIVTISPSIRNFDETASTLQFADRAMRVQVSASANKQLLLAYTQQNALMNEELALKYEFEINRLTQIVKFLLKKCVDHGLSIDMRAMNNNVSVHTHPAGVIANANANTHTSTELIVLQSDLLDVQKERDHLVKQLAHTQESLRQVQTDKRKILEAIFDDSIECFEDGNDDGVEVEDEQTHTQTHTPSPNTRSPNKSFNASISSVHNSVHSEDVHYCAEDIDFVVDSDTDADAEAVVDSLDNIEDLYTHTNTQINTQVNTHTNAHTNTDTRTDEKYHVFGSQQDSLFVAKRLSSKTNKMAMQYRVLAALREEIDRRREALVTADLEQEVRVLVWILGVCVCVCVCVFVCAWSLYVIDAYQVSRYFAC